MIEAVIFDYGNVIDRCDFRRFLARAAPHITSMDAIRDQYNKLETAHETGDLPSDQFIAAVIHEFDLTINSAEFAEAFNDIFEPIAVTRRVIRQLAGNYKLALLSNTNPIHFDRTVRRADIFSLFDTVTASHLVGCMKPQPKIYLELLRQLTIPAERCVFIDDLAANAAAARTAGMHAIHLEDAEELPAALAEYDINVD